MRDTLYIRLLGNDDASCEVCLSPARGLRQRAVRLSLNDALNNAAGCKLVVLVPSAEVRLTSVSVPARQPQKILQAAPYALEDQFAEDVETLHFAIGTTGADARTPVAVVARTTMQAWLAPFHARNLTPDKLLPDVLALPVPVTGRWQVLAEPAQAIVRTGAYSGFTCASADLAQHLQLGGAAADQTLHIASTDASLDFSALGDRADVRPAPGTGLDVLAATLTESGGIDLLQGSFAPSAGAGAQWRPWRLAAALASAWLLVSLSAQGIATAKMSRELARLDEANLRRFQALFPSESRIVDIAVQAEQQLTQLKGGGSRGGLFSLLDASRLALASEPALILQSLQFKDGALYLSLTGNDLQALDRLRASFERRREARLEVQSANSSSIGVQIRLKVTPA